MKLILASASPRRRELLEKLGVPFEVIVSDCDESLPEGIPAENAAELLAVRKAAAVAKMHPDAVVIGADTTVLLDDEILGFHRLWLVLKLQSPKDCFRLIYYRIYDTVSFAILYIVIIRNIFCPYSILKISSSLNFLVI